LEFKDFLLVAVADGHGSASCPFSKDGSARAVKAFCETMKKHCQEYERTDEAKENFRSYLNREGATTIAKSIDQLWKAQIEKLHKDKKRDEPLTDAGEIDKAQIWRQYGTTLLGIVLAPTFYFAFQLGDGDALLLQKNKATFAIESDKLLGIETHSLSHPEAWQKALATVGSLPSADEAYAFMLSTDGFANSYGSEKAFLKTCKDYYTTILKHGAEAVNDNLEAWLAETSENGSGDDITVVLAVKEYSPAPPSETQT
jgi:serine/threonine protein phosphatase PrpC